MTARSEKHGNGVAEIIIDREAKRNALNSETIAAIAEAARQIAADDDLRVVVLRAAGERAFSAGADVNELANLDGATAYKFIDGLRDAIQAVRDIPVPVICRIQGPCIGGAMELAAACDLRVANERATFCMPEVRVGIPSVIQAVLLPRLMGRGRAGWLVLSGDVIDCRTAEAWGFVERRVANGELDAALDRAVALILAAAPAAVRAQKKLLKDWDDLSIAQAVDASMRTFADAYKTDKPAAYMAKFRRQD